MDNVTLARATMGTSLGFHIVFAVLGVGLPLLMMVAEGLWLKTKDDVWLSLAQRWSKAFGILFAVGAVSGTALSFELGLLWPRFMAFSGAIFGLPFSAEGFAFFIEAIFLGLYLYGWNRLSPVAHWLASIPIAVSGALSAVFVVMANAWMNSPSGFHLDSAGRLLDVDPLAAALNASTPTEDPHMLVSAYVVTGFLVAAVYAVGLLRRHEDQLHRRGLILGMAMAAVALDPNAEVRGLDTFPSNDRPNTIAVHLSFDAMVGFGILIGLAAALFWLLCIRRRRIPMWRPLLWLIVVSGPASVVAMEAGWFVTEFGRQPWIVYGILRTSEAATTAPALGPTFLVFFAIYIGLALTTARLLLLQARRNRAAA